MRTGFFFLSALLVPLFFTNELIAQSRIIQTGTLPGYITLYGDFHTHTVFSDGEVWPSFRIREAAADGLDAIALTDHLEYHPHRAYLDPDDNAAFRIAEQQAEKSGILLIRGTEITRRMPPGHLNALFLPDSIVFEDTTFLSVIDKSVAAGAFIQWNHPGWKGQQPDGIARMYDIHHQLIAEKKLHGIEIYNDIEFYPEAIQWCDQYSLTMLGNTDIHGTTAEVAGETGNTHRVMTIVFATERRVPAIRDALFARRTVVWYGDTLAGTRDILEPFLQSIIKVTDTVYMDDHYQYLKVANPSDIPLHLIAGTNSSAPASLMIPARSFRILRVKNGNSDPLFFQVGNAKTGTLGHPEIAISGK